MLKHVFLFVIHLHINILIHLVMILIYSWFWWTRHLPTLFIGSVKLESPIWWFNEINEFLYLSHWMFTSNFWSHPFNIHIVTTLISLPLPLQDGTGLHAPHPDPSQSHYVYNSSYHYPSHQQSQSMFALVYVDWCMFLRFNYVYWIRWLVAYTWYL